MDDKKKNLPLNLSSSSALESENPTPNIIDLTKDVDQTPKDSGIVDMSCLPIDLSCTAKSVHSKRNISPTDAEKKHPFGSDDTKRTKTESSTKGWVPTYTKTQLPPQSDYAQGSGSAASVKDNTLPQTEIVAQRVATLTESIQPDKDQALTQSTKPATTKRVLDDTKTQFSPGSSAQGHGSASTSKDITLPQDNVPVQTKRASSTENIVPCDSDLGSTQSTKSASSTEGRVSDAKKLSRSRFAQKIDIADLSKNVSLTTIVRNKKTESASSKESISSTDIRSSVSSTSSTIPETKIATAKENITATESVTFFPITFSYNVHRKSNLEKDIVALDFKTLVPIDLDYVYASKTF